MADNKPSTVEEKGQRRVTRSQTATASTNSQAPKELDKEDIKGEAKYAVVTGSKGSVKAAELPGDSHGSDRQGKPPLQLDKKEKAGNSNENVQAQIILQKVPKNVQDEDPKAEAEDKVDKQNENGERKQIEGLTQPNDEEKNKGDGDTSNASNTRAGSDDLSLGNLTTVKPNNKTVQDVNGSQWMSDDEENYDAAKGKTSNIQTASTDPTEGYLPKIDNTTVDSSEQTHGHSTFRFVTLAILVVALAALVSYCFMDMTNKENTFDNYPNALENRKKLFVEIQKLFPNQTKRFWKILRSRSLAHLRNKNPDKPLVILLGAPPSACLVVNCLAKKLARRLDPEFNSYNIIDGSQYIKENGDETKKIIDDKLTAMFKRGARAAIVMHLEQLPAPSPLLFYRYCDNEAQYKHVGIIFTVYLPHEPSPSLGPKEAEESIEQFLTNVAFRQYPKGLVSRITDTVALVSHESDEVVQSVCDSQV